MNHAAQQTPMTAGRKETRWRNPAWPGIGLAAAALAVFCGGARPHPLKAQPTEVLYSSLGRPIQGVDAGEVLLGEFNCVACHQAGAATRQRLAPKHAPRLGASGLRLTPQYLRAYLTNPHGEGPGRTMPDLLHGMAAAEKAETVEALAHFLASQMSGETNAAVSADQFKMQQGRSLFHRVGCVACHAPHAAAAEKGALSVSNEGLADFRLNSIPLVNLARKTTVAELAKFLVDPLKVRPSGRMPSLNLTESEATAIAMYLLREQAPGLAGKPMVIATFPGLRYEYFEEAFNQGAPDFAGFTPKASGVVERFALTPLQRSERAGLRFTGFITVPFDGEYTFYTASDDGSRLYIGEQLVVNNDGLHAMEEKKGAIELNAGNQPITLTWFNGDAQLGLKVSWQGPKIEKQEIPASALTHYGLPMVPLDEEKFTVDAAKARRGRQLFTSLGCAACHEVSGEKIPSSLAAKSFGDLNPEQADGCLGENIRAGVPQYFLTRVEREALRATLAARAKLAQPLAAKELVTRTLAVMNCFACHARDGLGGPAPGRLDYFSVVGEADLGEEGRLPPHLTRVGDKLRSDWLREVLLNKGAVRPYMATRMPQFGEANVGHLPAAFEQADSAGVAETPLEYSAREAKQGRKLVGTGGMACISCHVFAGHKSLGIPALDLATMPKRLKRDWFHRYLVDPASLRPGTRMPTFWPDGKSVRPEILEGNTAKQIDAIWTYLSKGTEADLPPGLVQGKMELVADKEPIIYRNFIAGAGSRAIGVGYPEKVNLAFDANELRLALIWQGAFIDAARHRTGRGEGYEPPLGDNVMKLPSGAPFAFLADTNALWPDAVGKKAGYQMHGYGLDDQRRPIFLYTFERIEIEDLPVPVVGEVENSFRRGLVFRSERAATNLWFRAAVGSKIEQGADEFFVVDDKLKLRFGLMVGFKPLVRRSAGRLELLVPVVFGRKESQIVEEIVW